MRNILSIIPLIFLFTCQPTADKPVEELIPKAAYREISSIVKYNHGIGPRHEYMFNQKIIDDSIFVLNYYRESENKYAPNGIYIQKYTFELIPDTSIVIQKLTTRDTIVTPLWLLTTKKFQVDSNAYQIFKYAQYVTAKNFCISYNLYFWSPEFGILLWGHLPVLMHGSHTVLQIPADKEDSLIARKLMSKIYDDKDFFFDAFHNEKIIQKWENSKNTYLCDRVTSQIDEPDMIINFRNFIDSNIVYPANALDDCIAGHVSVDVRLDETGKLELKRASLSEREFGKYTKEFEAECLRVIESFPNLKPATFLGRNVRTTYSHRFVFELPDSIKCAEILIRQAREQEKLELERVFIVVEEMPEFPGGENALKLYLKENIKYPEQAKMDTDSGMIIVQFLIDENGTISKIEIIKSFESKYKDAFINEAIRLVKNMPKWNPGKVRGSAAKVQYDLPINFNPLNSEKEE